MSLLSWLLSRKRRAGSGPSPDAKPLIDGDDLIAQLFSHQGSSLWLGRYPVARVVHTFEKYGIFPALRELGIDHPIVTVNNLDLFLQSLKVFDGKPLPEKLVMELRVRETVLAPAKRFDDGFGDSMPRMLSIEWLLMQNPRAEFIPERPPLPGQQYPGLGLSKQVISMLLGLARRLEVEGIVYHPAYYHNARFAPENLKFYNPRWDGRMVAIRHDLGTLTPCRISWAFDLGCVLRESTGEVVPWVSSIQIFPISERVKAYLASEVHRTIREKAIAEERFVLDTERFNTLYVEQTAGFHGRIMDRGDSRPESTTHVPGGAVAEEKSLYQLLRTTAQRNPDTTAYVKKQDGTWYDISWSEHEAACSKTARAFMALGLGKGERACILGNTRLEWVQADFGIHGCGGVTVGIYPSNLAEDCAYIIDHCDAGIIVVEDSDQLAKIVLVRDKLPKLKHIIIIDGPGDPGKGVLTWEEFIARSDTVTTESFLERMESIEADDLASLVYTSGTTGVPKGAMLTHRNMLFASRSASTALALKPGLTTLLFLPLAHVFARLASYFCLMNRVSVAFAEGIPQVGENLREIKPDFICSVPRIFEKVYDKIISGAQEAGGIKLALFSWALKVGLQVSRHKQNKEPVPALLSLKYTLAEKLVFSKIHAALGGRMKWAVSGAAPLNKTVAEFFHSCGILIVEGLGMTENASFSNCNRYEHYKFGTVGPTGPGIEMRIAGDGEILFRGDNIMKGYFKNPEATAEAIDQDGWLHTGDVGIIDGDGFLKITDRKKDLIITAGGKNIAPQRIEQAISTSRFISQTMAYGDKRNYVTALLALNLEAVVPWANSIGLKVEDPSELISHPSVRELIAKEVESMNSNLASFETVKKFRILPRELTVEDGELTPSLKIKRPVVVERYGHLLDEMYE